MKKITITRAQINRIRQTGRVTIRRPIYRGPTVEQFEQAGMDLLPLVIGCVWYPSMITEKGVEVIGPDVYGFLHPADPTIGWKSPFGAPGDKIHLVGQGWVYIEYIAVKLARTRYFWEIGLKNPEL